MTEKRTTPVFEREGYRNMSTVSKGRLVNGDQPYNELAREYGEENVLSVKEEIEDEEGVMVSVFYLLVRESVLGSIE